MKRNGLITSMLVGLSLLVSLLWCGNVWADGVQQEGGASYGTGSTPGCVSEYNGIQEPICGNNGDKGGGRSWRIYKVTGDSLKALNKDASWNIVEGSYSGTKITGKNGVLSKCLAEKAPYIVLHGLNSVAMDKNDDKNFYVSFNRTKPGGDCRKNRGCYYDKNLSNALKSDKTGKQKVKTGDFISGQILTPNLAKYLYDKEPAFAGTDFTKVGAFCTWGGNTEEYTAVAYAAEVNGGWLNNHGQIDSDDYYAGGTAVLDSSDFNPPGYTWYAWNLEGGFCPNNIDRVCSHDNMPAANAEVIAWYVRDLFQGKTAVIYGNNSLDTGWKQNETVVASQDCPHDGCKIAFNHQIQRTVGNGPTQYSIDRFSNSTTYPTQTLVGGTTFADAGPSDVRNSGLITVKPGEIVCETLRVFPSTVGDTELVYSTACFKANELAQEGSFIDAKVRNTFAATTYRDWRDEVYAKPGDYVDFRTWYTPTVQSLADRLVNIVNGNTINATYLKNYDNWNNGYDVIGEQWSGYDMPPEEDKVQKIDRLTDKQQGTIGDDNALSMEFIGEKGGYKVASTEVGLTIAQTARTNIRIQNVPYKVSLSVEGGVNPLFVANIDWTPQSETASVHIPYNFENTTEVVGVADSKDGIVYAGEKASFSIKTIVNTKPNQETNGEYATKVPNAKWKIGISDSRDGDYKWGEAESGTLNEEGNDGKEGPIEEMKTNGMSLVIPDLVAGSEICVKSAVYPKDSGDDKNMKTDYYNPDDSSAWNYSEPKCLKVAKRPSIQVWGGNMFIGGNINISVAKKYHLDGYNNHNAAQDNDPYIFGSWGELGVIAAGEVKGFASGASLGYNSNNNDGTTYPDPYAVPNEKRVDNDSPGGYSGKFDFCKLSILTIPNGDCKSEYAGGLGSGSYAKGMRNDKETISELAKALKVTTEPVQDNTITIDGTASYYESDSELTINGGSIPANKTILIHSSRNIIINGNISYEDANYSRFSDTPKVIVYSDKNIIIDCKVERIDALLVADVVDTCETSDKNYNKEANSVQLTIYGSILANKLDANRTYGAATGVNSIVPAEIIDFDPTLYLWEGVESKDSESGSGGNDDGGDSNSDSSSIDVVYLRELAPRY